MQDVRVKQKSTSRNDHTFVLEKSKRARENFLHEHRRKLIPIRFVVPFSN